MISAGELRRKIIVQRATTVQNALNEAVETWTELWSGWGRRQDVSDAEKFAAGQVGSSLRSRFVVRASVKTRSITASDRLLHDGATWSIHGVKEAKEDPRRFLEITAVKDADI